MIKENWAAVEAVAKLLLKRTEVPGLEIENLVNQVGYSFFMLQSEKAANQAGK